MSLCEISFPKIQRDSSFFKEEPSAESDGGFSQHTQGCFRKEGLNMDGVGIGIWIFLTAYIVTGAVIGAFVKDNFARKEILGWMSKTFWTVILVWLLSIVVVLFVATILVL
jgi:hypothetical protein